MVIVKRIADPTQQKMAASSLFTPLNYNGPLPVLPKSIKLYPEDCITKEQRDEHDRLRKEAKRIRRDAEKKKEDMEAALKLITYEEMGPIVSVRINKLTGIDNLEYLASNVKKFCRAYYPIESIVIEFEKYVITLYYNYECCEGKFLTTLLEEDDKERSEEVGFTESFGKKIKDIRFVCEFEADISDDNDSPCVMTHRYQIVFDNDQVEDIEVWCNNGYYCSGLEERRMIKE